MSFSTLLFWLSILLLGYTYLGYPLLIWAWARLRPRPPQPGRCEPEVSVVVVAHNEAARIDSRIRNLLSLDYPRDRLEILIASDGSTDGTDERARTYERPGVRVLAFTPRRGKAAVLNDAVREARGEVVLLADARQRFDASAVRALVATLADPGVGGASGELVVGSRGRESALGGGVGFYWRYEKSIRRNESAVDSTVGATGAIVAFRRELFEPIPDDTILDDVLIPMRVTRRGYRVVFDPAARAFDRASASPGHEFARKVRTIAGNFQLLSRERWLLDPRRNRLWLQTLSHKGLRLLCPLFLGTALATNLLLLGRPLYRWTFAGQILFYAAAVAGHVLGSGRRRAALLGVPYVVCLLSWATVVGFLRFLSGRQSAAWERV